jgi:hypothetical protein
LKKEIEEITRIWKDLFSYIGRIIFGKMAILPKEMYRCDIIPTKISMSSFTVIEI